MAIRRHYDRLRHWLARVNAIRPDGISHHRELTDTDGSLLTLPEGYWLARLRPVLLWTRYLQALHPRQHSYRSRHPVYKPILDQGMFSSTHRLSALDSLSYTERWAHSAWTPDDGGVSSATTLVSVRNTRVLRTALTALTEPRTLWRRITRYPSPRRRVALHSISKMYFSHWSERMWSVNLDASISGVSDPGRAFLPAFRLTGSASDKPGSAGNMSGSTSNHSHVFSLFSHLCIYVSM